MKKYLLSALAIFFLATVSSFSQILKPVKWQFYTEKISDSEVNLVFKATIDDGWHIYGMDIPEGGPISTSFWRSMSPVSMPTSIFMIMG